MKKLFVLGLLLASAAATAQTPSPAAATPSAAVPVLSCSKPVLVAPDKVLSKKQSDKLNADNKTYQECIKTYINARKATVDGYNALIKPEADAAMAAKSAFDAYLDELNSNLAEREKLQTKE